MRTLYISISFKNENATNTKPYKNSNISFIQMLLYKLSGWASPAAISAVSLSVWRIVFDSWNVSFVVFVYCFLNRSLALSVICIRGLCVPRYGFLLITLAVCFDSAWKFLVGVL